MSAIFEKRREWVAARSVYNRLTYELRTLEQERARAGLKKLGPQQRRVLAHLASDEAWHEERFYTYRRALEKQTGFTTVQVRRALKALQRFGFVEYGKGLWTGDGEPAGSGWRATKLGGEWYWAKEAP